MQVIYLNFPLFLHGEREREVAEWIEGDGDLGALRANDGGLEEAVEQVQYHGVVALLVDIPRL